VALIKKVVLWGMSLLKIRYAPPHLTLNQNRMNALKRLIPGESPLVIDGGAHKGEFTELIHRQYSDPEIYCFEPIPALAKALHEKYEKFERVQIREAALGAKEVTVELNITNILAATSVLKAGASSHKYHNEGLETKANVNVSQVRLDTEITNDIDILKLDLQGYELEALKGTAGVLNKVKLVLVEIEFVPLYENQPLFSDIDIYMRENGFRLLNFYDLYTHDDGQLTSGDAIYLNNIFFK
jgi:FkbM family methyltransferase